MSADLQDRLSFSSILAPVGGLLLLLACLMPLVSVDLPRHQALVTSVDLARTALEHDQATDDTIRQTAFKAYQRLLERRQGYKEHPFYGNADAANLNLLTPALVDLGAFFSLRFQEDVPVQNLADAKEFVDLVDRASASVTLWNCQRLSTFVAQHPTYFSTPTVNSAGFSALILGVLPILGLAAIALPVLSRFRRLNPIFLMVMFLGFLVVLAISVFVRPMAGAEEALAGSLALPAKGYGYSIGFFLAWIGGIIMFGVSLSGLNHQKTWWITVMLFLAALILVGTAWIVQTNVTPIAKMVPPALQEQPPADQVPETQPGTLQDGQEPDASPVPTDDAGN